MTKTITATQARKDFFKLLRQAKTPGHFVRISLQDSDDDVIMMSADEWEGWMETLDIMSDPQLVADIREAERELKRGEKGITLQQLREEIGF